MRYGRLQTNQGFTLIETAIALVLIGLLVVPMLALWAAERREAPRGIALGNIDAVKTSLDDFVRANGRYPMPAGLTLSPDTALYGEEPTGAILPCASWPTPNGVCSTMGANPVLIGAIPFKTLGINEEISVDFWDNKLLYAVTASHTTAFALNAGQIIIKAFDENLAGNRYEVTLYPGVGSLFPVSFFVMSLGENGAGAYNRNGFLVNNCNLTTVAESENCDFDNTFWLKTNYFPEFKNGPNDLGEIGSASFIPGVNYFDDITDDYPMPNPAADLWFESTDDSDYLLTRNQRIGIGIENPEVKVHVIGNAMADNILSDEICNENSSACFNPNIIAGNEPSMDCEANSIGASGHPEAVLKIEYSMVRCASPVDDEDNPVDGIAFQFPAAHFNLTDPCTGLELMTGLDASGRPICEIYTP